ncbi:MAG: excinuclease ABC subunit UvrC [Vampirovibrionales bacterium]
MPTSSNPSLIQSPEKLKAILASIPHLPGVYQYYDAQNTLLYVGKAIDLRKRVSSYFQRQGKHDSPKTEILVAQIHSIEFLVTANETEALLLENNLIKAHKPAYNIALRDDKRYPWICIPNEPFPRVVLTRRRFTPQELQPSVPKESSTKPTKSRYYGPYTDVTAARQLLHIIRHHFPVRQRKTPLFADRPCMNYSIGLCPGPCQQRVTPQAYENTLNQIDALLKGNYDPLLHDIMTAMQAASQTQQYEWAAQLRDRAKAVEKLLGEQQLVTLDVPDLNMDVVAVAPLSLPPSVHTVQRGLMLISSLRQGRIVRVRPFPVHLGAVDEAHCLSEWQEALPQLLMTAYRDEDPNLWPDEILLPRVLSHSESLKSLSQWLTQQKKAQPKTLQTGKSTSTIHVLAPQRGQKKALLDRVQTQANEQWLAHWSVYQEAAWKATDGLSELATQLGWPQPPARMECYDISHVQGHQTVASMVVMAYGKPDKSQYRRFNLTTTEGKPDDFTSLHEALLRRAAHCTESPLYKGKNPWPTPDVFVIDGGKGQLSSAVKALQSAGLGHIPVISLAKRLEEIFLPEQPQPIVLPRNSAALFVLQQLRDEAHRFAITHHRKRRGKAATQSTLDAITGLSKEQKMHLLSVFGNVKALQQATPQALIEEGLLSVKLANKVFKALNA